VCPKMAVGLVRIRIPLFSILPQNRPYRHTLCPALLLLLFVVCCCRTGRGRRSGPSHPAGVQTAAPPDRRRMSEILRRHHSIRFGAFLVGWDLSEGRGRGGTGDRWAQRPLVGPLGTPPPPLPLPLRFHYHGFRLAAFLIDREMGPNPHSHTTEGVMAPSKRRIH